MKTITEIIVPQLAESLVSATIDKWLKQPGDWVDLYEPLCEILTDKVNAELPSTVAGRLVKILAESGETVPDRDGGRDLGFRRPVENSSRSGTADCR